MTEGSTARHALRVATAPEHERVDGAFGAFDLSSRDSYIDFLRAQAAAFLPVEAAIDRFDPGAVLPDWPQRRRADLLRADLAELDGETPIGEAFDIDSTAAALGAVYVLEGSRLGGALLARSVGAGLPRRFIGAADSTRWRQLIQLLDRTLVTQEQRAAAIDAARRVFALFETGAARDGRTS